MNIIQIGANKGFDNFSKLVFTYEPDQINNLIIIEPLAIHNESINNCYAKYSNKLHIKNIVITDDPSIQNIDFWYHPDDLTHGNAGELSSIDKYHACRIRSSYNILDMQSINLQCLTINNLLENFNVNTVDILHIDAEGMDESIIYSINFNKYIIKTIYYENLHMNKNKLRDFLINKHYNIDCYSADDKYMDIATLIHI